MKTHHTLDCVEEIDFSVFAINSHTKPYTLCWNINKTLQLNFEKVQNQLINNKQEYPRYKSNSNHGAEYNIIVNRSKDGYLIPDQKRVNYFLILNNKIATKSSKEIINESEQPESQSKDSNDPFLVRKVIYPNVGTQQKQYRTDPGAVRREQLKQICLAWW